MIKIECTIVCACGATCECVGVFAIDVDESLRFQRWFEPPPEEWIETFDGIWSCGKCEE